MVIEQTLQQTWRGHSAQNLTNKTQTPTNTQIWIIDPNSVSRARTPALKHTLATTLHRHNTHTKLRSGTHTTHARANTDRHTHTHNKHFIHLLLFVAGLPGLAAAVLPVGGGDGVDGWALFAGGMGGVRAVGEAGPGLARIMVKLHQAEDQVWWHQLKTIWRIGYHIPKEERYRDESSIQMIYYWFIPKNYQPDAKAGWNDVITTILQRLKSSCNDVVATSFAFCVVDILPTVI